MAQLCADAVIACSRDAGRANLVNPEVVTSVAEPHVLVVTSAGAPAGGGRAGARRDRGGRACACARSTSAPRAAAAAASTDRVRRALLGEGAERKLRRELEISPPDAAVVFDPHAALALTVARDQVDEPGAGDRRRRRARAGRGVGADRRRSVRRGRRARGGRARRRRRRGRSHPRRRRDRRARVRRGRRAGSRARCARGSSSSGKVALVEVAGLGAELTGQLALQLSLLDGGDAITFLFDAARRRRGRRRAAPPGPDARPARASCSARPPTRALLWRAADVIVARPRPEVDLARDARRRQAGRADRRSACRTARRLARRARGAQARDRGARACCCCRARSTRAFARRAAAPHRRRRRSRRRHRRRGRGRQARGDRRAPRRRAGRDPRSRARRERRRAAPPPRPTAMPGELEDLGGGSAAAGRRRADVPDKAELERLRARGRAAASPS